MNNVDGAASSTGISASAVARDAADVERQMALEQRLLFVGVVAAIMRLSSWIVSLPLLLGAALIVVLGIIDDTAMLVPSALAIVSVALGIVIVARVATHARKTLARRVITIRAPHPAAPWWKGLIRATAIAAATLLVAASTAVVVVAEHSSRLQVLAFERDYLASRAAFIADRDRLRRLPLFEGIGHERDAGAFLNAAIAWSRQPSAGSWPLVMPESLPQPVEQLSFDGVDLSSIMRFDTSWMTQLHSYDHWTIDEAPERREDFDFIASPFPRFGMLLDWAKVRAVQGYALGDVKRASDDLHQLARLTASTGSLIAAMAGSTILVMDARLIEAQRRRAPETDLSWWRPFSVDDRLAVFRAGLASIALMNPYLPEEASALLDGSTRFDCIGLQEGLHQVRTLRALLADDRPARFASADDRIVTAAKQCGFSGLLKTWSQPPETTTTPPCEADAPAAQKLACLKDRLQRVPLAAAPIERWFAVECFSTDCNFSRYR